MDDQAFLRAICENPDDDAPRLVYADWLEERGRGERAEFIRVQIALARATSREQGRSLRRRETELLGQHGPAWQAELPQFDGIRGTGGFDRGFPSMAYATWDAFKAHGAAILEAAPIQNVMIQGMPTGGPPRFRSCRCLSRISRLSVFPSGGAAPHRRWGPRLASELASAACLSQLRHLELAGCDIQDSGAGHLAESPHFTKLQGLVLSNNRIGNPGATGLAVSTSFRSVSYLVLSQNHIGQEGAHALARARHLGALQQLHLQENPLDALAKRLLRQRFGARVCRF